MELVFTDSAHNQMGIISAFTLDMAFGADENDFRLTVPASSRMAVGSYVYEYGTERGGVIDAEEYDSTGDVPVLSYTGRTWHGIMDNSVVRPSGDYLTLNGDAYAAFAQLIQRQGLQGVLRAPEGQSGLVLQNYRVPRYVTLYEALGRIAAQFGKRLDISKRSGLCTVGIADVDQHTGGVGSDLPLIINRNHRQVNHLVLLGKGELSARLVRDVYADERGNVSTTQKLFGLDEIAEVYETSSQEDASKLLEDGIDKLKDRQQQNEVVVYVPPGETYHIGDMVRGVAPELGISAQSEIVKQVVTVGTDGMMSVSCMVGEPSFTTSR